MDDVQKGLTAIRALLSRAKEGKPFKGIEKEIATMGRFIASRTPAQAADMFEAARMMGQPAPAPLSPPKRYKRVIWEYHMAKSGPMAGHKVKWTCTWEGLKLRVDHTMEHNLVIFRGFIGDEAVAAEKGLALAQTAVADEARRRVRLREAD